MKPTRIILATTLALSLSGCFLLEASDALGGGWVNVGVGAVGALTGITELAPVLGVTVDDTDCPLGTEAKNC